MRYFTSLFFVFILAGCSTHPGIASENTEKGTALTELWKSAETAYNNQEWEDSFHLYSKLSDKLIDAEIEFKKGVSSFRTGRIKLAESSFEKAIEINPTHRKSLYNLAIINMSRGYAFLHRYQNSLSPQERSKSLNDILEILENFSEK